MTLSSEIHIPHFSIVLPTYGVARYLPRMLEDLQAQTYGDWEAIVVDDASPDMSADIAKSFAATDKRIRIVHHVENQGLAAARNTGIREARGRYVTFLDPDDRCEPALLEEVAASLERQQAQVVLFGHTEDFWQTEEGMPDEALVRSIAYPVLVNNEAKKKEFVAEAFRPQVLSWETGIHYGYAWNKFYQLEILRKASFQFQDDPLIEDIEFNIAVFDDLETLNVIPEPLYHYAKRESANLTNKFVPRYFELHRKRIQLLVDQQKSWGLFDDRARAILGGLYTRFIISALERNFDPESQMSSVQRKAWVRELFQEPLFNELVPSAHAESALLNIAFIPLKKKSVVGALALGKAVHLAKQKAASAVRRAKTKR